MPPFLIIWAVLAPHQTRLQARASRGVETGRCDMRPKGLRVYGVGDLRPYVTRLTLRFLAMSLELADRISRLSWQPAVRPSSSSCSHTPCPPTEVPPAQPPTSCSSSSSTPHAAQKHTFCEQVQRMVYGLGFKFKP